MNKMITPVPITPAIIKQVHDLAEQDGMPKGLKIMNRTGHVLYDSAWIAGVDYDEDEFEDEDYEPDDGNDDNDDDDDQYDEMDPDEIAALAEPAEAELEEEDEDPMSESEEEQEEEEDPGSKSEEEEEEDPNPTTVEDRMQRTSSGRNTKPRDVLTNDECKTQYSESHLQTQAHEQENYSLKSARVITVTMCHFNINSYATGHFLCRLHLMIGHGSDKKHGS